MGFLFRFAALLKQRRYELKQAQLELARAKGNHEQALAAQERLGGKISLWQETWQRDQADGMSVSQHLLARDHLLFLEKELERAALKADQKARELDERKVHLIECEKKVRMLELLEEKDMRAFNFARAQREQKLLDERVIFRKKSGERQ